FKFDEIFRMNPSSNIQPYGNFIRVSGPNIEPSMFSIFLILIVSILLFDNIQKNYKDIILLIMNGILTTSSTFFVGLFLICLNYIIFSKNRVKILKIVILISLLYLFLILIYPQILFLTTGIIDKIFGKGISGSERSFDMINHFKVGLAYPLTGIGYGMARSKDLISSWIANIGFLGVGLFILSILASVKKTNTKTKGFYVGLVVIFLLEFISVPEPYFIYIWLIWGIMDSGNLKEIK
ncbi:MAG: hypothetical protein ACRDDH_11055, partial [Cetobacterium sp.]|uniref:hypothetical protein n=1 Tax=Cetobacterium sp. TaxID=2071632 RepID=UPI003EE486C0